MSPAYFVVIGSAQNKFVDAQFSFAHQNLIGQCAQIGTGPLWCAGRRLDMDVDLNYVRRSQRLPVRVDPVVDR